jgi:hypothetical protein
VEAVAFRRLPDGRSLLASGSEAGTVQLCDPVSARTLMWIPVLAAVKSLAFAGPGALAVGLSSSLLMLDLAIPRSI